MRVKCLVLLAVFTIILIVPTGAEASLEDPIFTDAPVVVGDPPWTGCHASCGTQFAECTLECEEWLPLLCTNLCQWRLTTCLRGCDEAPWNNPRVTDSSGGF